jgi:starch-binding outer membrane protein, SusD/RagB family
MKKYIYKFSFTLFLITALSGCNDDFLERLPLDEISNETFWNTENDLLVYNNGLYAMTLNNDNVPIMMGHSTGNNIQSIWFQDAFSDNLAPLGVGYFQLFRAGRQIVQTTSAAQTFGYKGWDFVRAINVGLENYDKAKVSQAIKDKYIAEARLFRGWFYAEKVTKFGDVPYLEKSLNINSEELFAPRMPRDEAMEKILADINFAVAKLPASWNDGSAPGRINRWCALLVKSRVCLFEGTFRKYHGLKDADKWLTEASLSAKEIMDKGPYALHSTGDPNSDYSNYQRLANFAGNKEVMYWKKYQTGIYNNNVDKSFVRTIGGATKNFVEDYLCTDGLPISLSPLYKGDAKIEDVFINRDPRMRQTIFHPEDNSKLTYDIARTYPRVTGMTGGNVSTTGYNVIKNFNFSLLVPTFNTGETPAIVMRFGEVLLNYAEAQAELGKLTQADLDLSINRLRTRVGMPKMDLTKIPVDPRYISDGVSPLIVEIRRERRIELFCEGFRYNDLKRWKQGKKLATLSYGILWDAAARARYVGANLKSSIDPVSKKTYIDVYQGTDVAVPVFDEAKDYLWPIPLSSLAQNPALKQNPGW